MIHVIVNCSVESATHLSHVPRAARPANHTQVNDSCMTNYRIEKEHRPRDSANLVRGGRLRRTFPGLARGRGRAFTAPPRGQAGAVDEDSSVASTTWSPRGIPVP